MIPVAAKIGKPGVAVPDPEFLAKELRTQRVWGLKFASRVYDGALKGNPGS